jgi:hypothetical protein
MLQDLVYALRMIRRNPGVMVVAVLTLALGIGANTAIFSVIYALLLRSLPVSHPEQLKFLVQQTRDGEIPVLSLPAYRMLRDRSRSLAGVAAFNPVAPTLIWTSAGLEMVHRERASAGYFPALGLRPAAGRFFTEEEDYAPASTVVISYRYWTQRLKASPAAIGAELLYNKQRYTIVGVAPPGFSGLMAERSVDVWFPTSQGLLKCVNDPGWPSGSPLAPAASVWCGSCSPRASRWRFWAEDWGCCLPCGAPGCWWSGTPIRYSSR